MTCNVSSGTSNLTHSLQVCAWSAVLLWQVDRQFRGGVEKTWRRCCDDAWWPNTTAGSPTTTDWQAAPRHETSATAAQETRDDNSSRSSGWRRYGSL